MGNKYRGKCVIINNCNFDSKELPKRTGTEVDKERLTNCFEKLGFNIQIWDDLSAFDIKIRIERLSKEDFTDHDCLIICVLTHGNSNGLYGKDKKYHHKELFEPFKADLCKSLGDKPKVFIIQACRGDKLDKGALLKFGNAVDANSGDVVDANLGDAEDSNSEIRIPQWQDFLMAYSTVHDYYSWRKTTNESWFIEAFCEALESNREKDLLTILTITNRIVAVNYQSRIPGSELDKSKQMPMISSTLTRLLY